MPELTIKEHVEETVTILTPVGRIRLGSGSESLRAAIRSLTEKDIKRIVVDLGEVSDIDSSGIGELVSSFTTAYKHECIIVLARLTAIPSLLTITKLMTVFDVYDSVAEAVESIKSLSFSDFVKRNRQ